MENTVEILHYQPWIDIQWQLPWQLLLWIRVILDTWRLPQTIRVLVTLFLFPSKIQRSTWTTANTFNLASRVVPYLKVAFHNHSYIEMTTYPVYHSIYLSCLSLYLSLYLPILSISLSITLSIYLSYLSCLSIYPVHPVYHYIYL